MTELSRQMYENATRVQTVAQASELLKEYGHFRTLGDILRACTGSDNPKQLLVEGILELTPGAVRDSVDRKVRNWLSGRTGTVSKQDAFLLSRVLKLDLEGTDTFLRQVTGEGIHWRNPEDIVWGYGIMHDLPYGQILDLLERAKAVTASGKGRKHGDPKHYTADVKAKLQPTLHRSEEELLLFLQQQAQTLGTFHNTAYRLFMQYMELLESGGQEDRLEDNGKMNSRDILEQYLYRQLVPVSKKNEARAKDLFSGVQRSIRLNWPDETAISKMKHRELDVSRKILILLFLATDGSESEYEELDEDEDILTRDEVFQNIYTRLNRMLQACGFQMLDPRGAFDWMVLYCICVDDLWDVDLRLKEMLLAMFPDVQE